MQTLKHMTARFKDNGLFSAENELAVEELLEIYVDDSPYAITMRLPGDDINLAAGFCFTEGIIRSCDDIASIKHCEAIPGERRVMVRLSPDRKKAKAVRKERAEYLSKSSCGLCGKREAEEIFDDIPPVETCRHIELEEILRLKDVFEGRQAIFPRTGATHSAAAFDDRANLLAFAEDIGRHNAFDKVIGALLRTRELGKVFLGVVSSRLSFEMVQKAGVAGFEVFAGLSAPTSLAVAMAERLNMTLIGFLREKSMSIYTHPERVLRC
ncbi:MAG TPA: formate dehydrogenase accessory sulfurtransferase FdhD [Syntrophobacter fumaroxidans]|nr:formate dehydrogenase accessory sulfurtransferase FdhD [Syntrophobacter fumaroxidans]